MKKHFNTLLQNQAGMSLSTTIALAFGGAVVLVFLIGVVTYFVKS